MTTKTKKIEATREERIAEMYAEMEKAEKNKNWDACDYWFSQIASA